MRYSPDKHDLKTNLPGYLHKGQGCVDRHPQETHFLFERREPQVVVSLTGYVSIRSISRVLDDDHVSTCSHYGIITDGWPTIFRGVEPSYCLYVLLLYLKAGFKKEFINDLQDIVSLPLPATGVFLFFERLF